MIKAVVDRFEGKYAVLFVDGQAEPLLMLRRQLPRGTRAGDHLQVDLHEGQVIQAERDDEATEQAKTRIQAKLERLRRGEHLLDDPRRTN